MSPASPQPNDPSSVPSPGFSTQPPPEELSGFDPSESPLDRGGLPTSHEPLPADSSLAGLGDPYASSKRRVMFRVRREGWVARRQQARSRFRTITGNKGSSTPRLMAGLDRRGLLVRSKENAVRPRFNMRGLLRGS